ncbi:MAG: HpcH/HpaI aldolase family protein [Sedimentisphaerales bacterium]
MEFRLAKLVKNGAPAIGTWVELCDSGVVQVLANAGFDWVCIDMEHNPFDESQLHTCICVAQNAGISPVVRVRKNDESLIKLTLDLGAEGVVVPGIVDAEDAAKAVSFAKYPPVGIRGYGPIRATNFWADKKEYDESVRDNILLICQIERKSALNEVDKICKMPDIDAVFIGPADLSMSMGYHGNSNHPDVQDAIKTIIDSANKNKKIWGGIALDEISYMEHAKKGALLTTLGADYFFMQNAAAKEAKAVLNALAAAGLRK